MAKAQKLSQLLIGKEVTLLSNLCDISGEPHPAAGERATVIARNSKTAYQVATEDGAVYVVQQSGWTDYPNKLHPGMLAEQRETINLYLDSRLNQVQQLLPATIHASPFNPRTNYPEAEMQELAESAKEVGIIQPVLVRPRGDGSYELVFGHRRHRAALQAGLAIMPAIVRDLTDAQSAQLQAVENVQRRDLDPIDEALGYAAFIAAHGISKDELARQIGKSRTHVYNRLKLATLHPEGQAALRAGKLRTEVATLVARVPGEKNQAKALALALEGGYAGELKSYRTARSELTEKFTLDLKGALWSLDDATLVPGADACTVCPKRSGVDPIVYADFVEEQSYRDFTHKGENICTDSDCFAAKKTAQLKRDQDALEAKGKFVVAGNAARKAVDAYGQVKGDYIPVSEMREAIKAANKGTVVPAVQTMVIQDPRNGKTIEVVKRKEAEAAGLKVPTNKPASLAQQQTLNYQAQRVKEEAQALKKTGQNLALLHQVRSLPSNHLGNLELKLVAQIALDSVPYIQRATLAEIYEVEHLSDLREQIEGMGSGQLTRLMLDCALVRGVSVQPHTLSTQPEALQALARHYGVQTDGSAAAVTLERTEVAA